jgi:hypothetical protein
MLKSPKIVKACENCSTKNEIVRSISGTFVVQEGSGYTRTWNLNLAKLYNQHIICIWKWSNMCSPKRFLIRIKFPHSAKTCPISSVTRLKNMHLAKKFPDKSQSFLVKLIQPNKKKAKPSTICSEKRLPNQDQIVCLTKKHVVSFLLGSKTTVLILCTV